MPLLDAKALSLADLEANDPGAPEHRRNRRFYCPLAGCHGVRRDASHRNLSANIENGAWNCKRCGESGKLREYHEKGPQACRRERTQSGLRSAFSPRAVPVLADLPTEHSEGWRGKLRQVLKPLEGTPGEDYLNARGIPVGLAQEARVRYCPRWEHWEQEGKAGTGDCRWVLKGVSRRVVFPVYAEDQRTLVGVQARSISPADDHTASKLSRGEISRGVFATTGAWNAEEVALVEAPIDALSLAVCGLPALATLGTNLPAWLAHALAFRRVLIGTDADEPGNAAADRWRTELRRRGAVGLARLKPEGSKDWNEALTRDPAALRAYIQRYSRTAAELLS